MQVKFGEFNAMENTRKQNQGKPSRDWKQQRENKRNQG